MLMYLLLQVIMLYNRCFIYDYNFRYFVLSITSKWIFWNSIHLNDSVYSSVFSMLTGLHGFHVFVGVFLSYVCLNRVYNQEYSTKHYVGLVCSIWYWHFVDGVWVLLYLIVYVWGNWTIILLVYIYYFKIWHKWIR